MSRSSAKPNKRVPDELPLMALRLSMGGIRGIDVAREMGISKTWANLLIKRGRKIEKFRNQAA